MTAVVLLLLVAVAPPGSLDAIDNPNDAGSAIRITWAASEGDSGLPVAYGLFRSTTPDSGFELVSEEPGTSTEVVDNGLSNDVDYYYRLAAVAGGDTTWSGVVGPVRSSAQWFHRARLNILVMLVVIAVVFFVYLFRARRGAKFFIRRIAGLDALDDALGRATEMGKPILFSFGLGYITDLVVIAGLPLLRKIASKAAEYSLRLIVPNSDPIVMTAAQETVKEAYVEAGRPDLYNADNITFVTSDQFGYAAGVDGILLRERPGAVFWLGYFYAESLIMAETGHSVGAIQLAGTTETTQLPFFVAACDYTMIGEEIFAASSYLRPEPVMVSTLKGEDFLKLSLIVIATVGTLLGTAAAIAGPNSGALQRAYETVVGWFTLVY